MSKNPKDEIKKALWMRAFKVKDVAGLGQGYHLLVEGKWRVRVVLGTDGPHAIVAKGCDVIAIYAAKGNGKAEKLYAKASGETPNGSMFREFVTNPKKIFV